MPTCPECDSYKLDQLNGKWFMACRDCGTTFRLYPQNQKGGINLNMEYEKVVKHIGEIRATIVQEFEEIKTIKERALSVLKEELASYHQTIKELKAMQKELQKA